MTDFQIFLSHSTQDNPWCRPFVAAAPRQISDAPEMVTRWLRQLPISL